MAEEYLIIDGYNVLNAWPELIELKEKSFEHARERLIMTLSDYQALKGCRVIIVFDAHQVKGGDRRVEKYDYLTVIYTQEGETADMLIEKLVSRLPQAAEKYVVTSDRLEQGIILGKGAYRCTARELYQEVVLSRRESQRFFQGGTIASEPLDGRLNEEVREILEKWRRRKS